MSKTILYIGSSSFREHYLFDILTNKPYKVTESEFFFVVGYDRCLVPMHYDNNNINRQNFYFNDLLIGYRER